MRTTLTTTFSKALAVPAALALILTGCSDDGTDNTDTDSTVEQTSEEDAPETGTDEGTEDDSAQDDEDADADADDDQDENTEDAEAASGDGSICVDFFDNGITTLAVRSDNARTLLEEGGVTDPGSFAEVNLLKQRIEDLTATASGDEAALLERVNAPFVEASAAVLDSDEQDPTSEELEVGEIDVTDSAAAQEELLTHCG